MTDETHPSYPNPTIAEALCEIGFAAQPSRLASDFLAVWPEIEKNFPLLEVHTDVLTALPGLGAATVPGLAEVPERLEVSGLPPLRTRFSARRTSRPVTVEFAPGVFAIGIQAPYLGWETFRRDIEQGWTPVQSAWKVERVNHLVVRYINQVPLPVGAVSAEDWLTSGPFLAQTGGAGSFQSQMQTGTGTPNVTTVWAAFQGGTGTEAGLLTVDIECSLRGDFAADPAAVLGQIDALHNQEWRLFEALKGRRWNDVLEGKEDRLEGAR